MTDRGKRKGAILEFLGILVSVHAPLNLAVELLNAQPDDNCLSWLPDVYFEGGDHTTLIRASGDAFRLMVKDARRGRFSHHV